MRNITLTIFFVFFNIIVFAQLKVELTIENIQVIDDEAFFDIYLRSSSDSGEVINLAFSDFIIDYDPTVFVSPTLEKIDNPNPPNSIQNGYCSFTPTVTDEMLVWLSQSYYYSGTYTDIIDDKVVINLNPPLPYDDIDFDQKIAIIDEQATHRLGSFKLTGYQAGATVDLNWITQSANLETKVYGFQDQYPYAGDKTVITENIDPPNFIPTVPIFIQDEVQKGMIISPNPAIEIVTLSLPMKLKKDAQIIVYNLIGKQIDSNVLLAGHKIQEIDLKGFPAGYYLIQLKGDDFQVTKKVFKTK